MRRSICFKLGPEEIEKIDEYRKMEDDLLELQDLIALIDPENNSTIQALMDGILVCSITIFSTLFSIGSSSLLFITRQQDLRSRIFWRCDHILA